jgi:17 kDa outer membrane surface antigen
MLIPVAIVVTLCGCAAGGLGLSKAEIDPSITTGAVNTTAPANPEQRSDEATIRNAVSSADIELLKTGVPLPWANADTGSRGAISSMLEKKENGVICREFTASRESFDGVALYSGDACQGDRGNWFMRSFKPL